MFGALLLSIVCLALAQQPMTYYSLTHGEVYMRKNQVEGATTTFGYVTTIDEAASNTPGSMRFVVSYTEPRNIVLSLFFCTTDQTLGSLVVAPVACVQSPCELFVAPCRSNNDQYIYDTQYYFQVANGTSEFNVTVFDEAASLVVPQLSGVNYGVNISSRFQGAQDPNAYVIFKYDHADTSELLSVWLENANSSSLFAISFTNSADTICTTSATPPFGAGARVTTFLESHASCADLSGTTRFIYVGTPSATSSYINAYFLANSNVSSTVTLQDKTETGVSFPNPTRPTAYFKFDHPSDRFMILRANNSAQLGQCRVYAHQGNTGGIPTASLPNSCFTKTFPDNIYRTLILPSNAVDLIFPACWSGATWYVTLMCERSMQDSAGNNFYFTLTNKTQTEVFGSISQTNFGVTNTNVTTPVVWSLTNSSELPDGETQRVVDIEYASAIGPQRTTIWVARGDALSTGISNCDTNNAALSYTATAGQTATFSWVPCYSSSKSGALYVDIEPATSTFSYNLTVTTRPFGTIPLNSTRTGTLQGRQYHYFVPTFPSDSDPMLTFETDSTIVLTQWNNTGCASSQSASIGRNYQRFFFCNTGPFGLPSSTSDGIVRVSSPTQFTSNSYSLTSTTYPLDSKLRTFWGNTSEDINVTIDTAFPVQTVEWDNHNEGFQITLTSYQAPILTINIYAYDDCNFVGTIPCFFTGVGATCSFGTASTPFPGSFSGGKIRLLLVNPASTVSFSVGVHYSQGGNCRAVTNIASRFCAGSIDNTKRYNFISAGAIDNADRNAQAKYNESIIFFNSSISAQCIADLKNFACGTYFQPCESISNNVDKTCSGACAAIAETCGSNQCFSASCSVTTPCDSSSSSSLFGWLSLPLLSLYCLYM